LPISVPSKLIEFILLGPADYRRQLQNSPILGDVWIEFGKKPADSCDLLISPNKTQHAGEVACTIEEELVGSAREDANIAHLQGLVVARLSFEDVVRIVVPRTRQVDQGGAAKGARERKLYFVGSLRLANALYGPSD
jgi:serine protease AprX